MEQGHFRDTQKSAHPFTRQGNDSPSRFAAPTLVNPLTFKYSMKGAYVPSSRKIKKIIKGTAQRTLSNHAYHSFKSAISTAQALGADIPFCKRQISAYTRAMNAGKSFSFEKIDGFIEGKIVEDYNAFISKFYAQNPYFDRHDSEINILSLSVSEGATQLDSAGEDIVLMSLESLPDCIAAAVMSMLLFISRSTNIQLMDFEMQCGWIYEFIETEGLNSQEVHELNEWLESEWSGENEHIINIELEIPEHLRESYILFRQTYAEFVDEISDVSQLAAIMNEYIDAKTLHDKAETLMGMAVNDPYELALLLLSINEGIRSEYKEVIDWLEASCDMLMRMNLVEYSASELDCEHGSLLGSELIALNYDRRIEYLIDTAYQDSMNSGSYGCTIDWTSHENRSAVLSMFPYISIYLAMPERLQKRI